MTANECLQLLRSIKDVAFATVDADGRPQVRIIDVMLVEQETLYFCTARGKDFYRQLMATGQVAITGMTREYQMIRLSGTVQALPNKRECLGRIFARNPSMNAVYPGESRWILEPFCIRDGQLSFFDLSETPIVRESFSIGAAKLEKTGFFITESCIGCGVCARNCPQRCIVADAPYCITQRNCLHCGLCFETCPIQAIRREGE